MHTHSHREDMHANQYLDNHNIFSMQEIVHEFETCAHIISTVALEAFNTLE